MWMGLIWLTEWQKFAKWLIKQNSTLCCIEEKNLKHSNPKRLKMKERTHLWGKWQQENRDWDPDTRVDFKPKGTKWDKGHIPAHKAVILKIPLRMRLAKWTKNRKGGKSSKLHNR